MSGIYRVLARKYRPATFNDLEGQSLLTQTLTQAINNKRLPHAFLLHGIRGTGKTTTARILARALNCTGVDGQGDITPNPCGVCPSCVAIAEDRHLDILEMDAASRTGVDDIREIIESSRYKAVMGRYKIFIIDEVHMLSKSAFNALLKTLEEPPPHVIFIFATTEIRKIPDTVLSRCLRFDLKPMDIATLVKHINHVSTLENFTIDEKAANFIARAADGSMRDGLSMLDQAMALSQVSDSRHISEQTVSEMLGLANEQGLQVLVEFLLKGDPQKLLSHCREILAQGADPLTFLHSVLDFIYLLNGIKTSPGALPKDYLMAYEVENLQALGAQASPIFLMRLWQMLLNGYQEVLTAPSPSKAFEMLLLRACYLTDLPPLENIINGESSGSGIQGGSSFSSQGSSFTKVAPQVSEAKRIEPSPEPKTSEPSPFQHSQPDSFKALVALLNEGKESLLASHLSQDVHFIGLNDKTLTLRFKESCPSNIKSKLALALQKLTGEKWTILGNQAEGQKTLREQEEELRQKEVEALLEQPALKKIMAAFPDAKIDIKYKENP
jgi:DNA polymerase-3 subunit gamma/tau